MPFTPPRTPKLNNKARSSQGINTGATRDLTVVPSRGGIAGANFVDDVDTKLYVTSRHAPEESFVDLTNWNPQFGKQPFAQKINTAPLPNPYRFNADNRDLHLPSVSQTGYLQAAEQAPRPVTQVVEKLPFTTDGEGYVGFKTYWDNVAGKTAPYPKHVIADPNYPATRKWIEDPLVTGGGFEGNTAFGVWKEHTQPIVNGKLYRIGSTPGTTDGYPIIPRLVKEYSDAPSELTALVAGLNKNPQTREMLTERQMLNDIDQTQKYGMSVGGQDMNSFDINMGSKRFYDTFPGIGRYIGRTDESLKKYDVARSVGGIGDARQLPYRGTVKSDYYSMAPQHARGQYQEVIVQGDNGLIERKLVYTPGVAPSTTEVNRLPTYPETLRSGNPHYSTSILNLGKPVSTPVTTGDLPTLPVTDPRVKAARLADNAAYLDYASEQQALIKQRPGSFNIVVDNDGNMARLEAEGLLPSAPASPVAGVFHRDGTPFFPQPSAYNGKMSPTLPDGKKKELYVDIPGMGQIPNGERQRFPLTPSLARKVKLDPQGSAIAMGYDPSNPYTWDALTALNAKQETTSKARIKANAVAVSSNATDEQKLAFEAIANKHETEYAEGLANYQRALSYEPQSTAQKVSVTINNGSTNDAIDLLRDYGLKVANSNGIVVGTGTIPIDKHLELTGKLASQYNREQLVLPPDVSVASNYSAFKNAGIPEDSLVRGVKLSVNDKGEKVVVDPGEVVGNWEGQRIVVGNVAEPTVQPIVTARAAKPDDAPDREWRRLLIARDEARAEARDRVIEIANARRRARGDDEILVGRRGYLYFDDTPSDTISTVTPEVANKIVFSAAANRSSPFGSETAAVLNQALHLGAVQQSVQNQILAQGDSPSLGMDSPLRYSTKQTTMPVPKKPATKNILERGDTYLAKLRKEAEAVTPNLEQNIADSIAIAAAPSSNINSTGLQRNLSRGSLPEHNPGAKFDLTAIAREMGYLPESQPVVRPATIDLNAAPITPPPPLTSTDRYQGQQLKVHFVRSPEGVKAIVGVGDNPGTVRRVYTSQADYDNAVATAQANGWDITHSTEMPAAPQLTPQPVSGSFTSGTRQTRTRSGGAMGAPTPIPTSEPTPLPTPTPIIVQDPADNWNRYVPYAAAVGALGLGGAGVYAMTRPSDEDRKIEEARQQQMYQYAMMQRMHGRPIHG